MAKKESVKKVKGGDTSEGSQVLLQQCILLGVAVVFLGGMVFLTSTPTREAEEIATQETAEPTLPARPPEGYQVPARPAVTFPHTNVSADRLRLANVRHVSDGENLSFVEAPSPSNWTMSPDGKMSFSHREGAIIITRTDDSRVLFEIQDVPNEPWSSGAIVWSWDSKYLFYPGKSFRSSLKRVEIATGEVTEYTDVVVLSAGSVRSLASARYPRDPVIWSVLDQRGTERVRIDTYDGSARWGFGYDVDILSLSPDKQMILVDGPGFYTYSVYTVVDSRLLHSFSFPDATFCCLSWSPDGKKFAYQRTYLNDGHQVTASDIYLMHADGSGRAQLTDTPDVHEGVVGWTLDGRLVFKTYEDDVLHLADLVADSP